MRRGLHHAAWARLSGSARPARARVALAWPAAVRVRAIAVLPTPTAGLAERAAAWGIGRTAAIHATSLFLWSAGVAGLVFTYAQRAGVLPFWVAIALGVSGVLVAGLSRGARVPAQALALVGLGLLLYLPYFLRSPQQLLFTDELFHQEVMRSVLETGSTDIEATFYPIPGDFPGIPFVAIAIQGATGATSLVSIRIATILFHCVSPLLVFGIGRAAGLRRRLAFLAAVLYCANTSYGFFHATFAYESLGIVFFLAMWLVLLTVERPEDPRVNLVLAALLLAGVTVTHHVSSYIIAGTIVLFVGIGWRLGRSLEYRLVGLAVASVALPLAWLGFASERARRYLETTLGSRVEAIADILSPTQSTSARGANAGVRLPPIDLISSRLYIPAVLALVVTGVVAAWVRGRFERRDFESATPRAAMVTLLVVGPVAWIASLPAIFTSSADVAFRAWPFLFLGVAIYLALGIDHLRHLVDRRRRLAGLLFATPVVILLIAGGIVIGDNQAGRFPTEHPRRAAGPEAATPDTVRAARWLRTRGLGDRIVGDQQSHVTFAVYGGQRAPGWGAWIPFLAEEPAEVERYLGGTETRYVIVDRRISRLPPRYTGYFGKAELYARGSVDYGAGGVFPERLLDKFDDVERLGRVYDSGDIRIYDHAPLGEARGRSAP